MIDRHARAGLQYRKPWQGCLRGTAEGLKSLKWEIPDNPQQNGQRMNPKCYTKLPDASSAAMLCHRLIIIVVMYALFMPFFGPMLDHHFAERQHNHQHIYFGSAGAKHTHFYQLLHLHSHTHNTPTIPPTDGSQSNESPNEVIYLTSQDGIEQSAPSFTIPALQVDFVFPDLGDHHFLLNPTGQDSLPPEIFIPPPKRPPRG
jgi:hypothetical protein